MAQNQINKLVWIVETIRAAKAITFKELNEKWMNNEELSGGDPLLKRTFHKWREYIWENFGLEIECERGREYRYSISNIEDLKSNSVEQWLLNTYSLSNSIEGNKAIRQHILLEDIPSGQTYLMAIIDAIKNRHTIRITYYNYWREDEKEHTLMPLCVKLFRKRWYFVGKSCNSDKTNIFCLDRIRDFHTCDETFVYPEDFSEEDYFFGFYGVIRNEDVPMETVKLKVTHGQANYIRDLPIQEDFQREVESNDKYSIFEIRIRPTFDFKQELLWNGDMVEVLEPKWFRDEMKETVKSMMNNYKK